MTFRLSLQGVVFAVVFAGLAASQDCQAEMPFKHWQFSRPIEAEKDAKEVLAAELDGKVYDASREDLGDLRITSSQGATVPYTIRTQREVTQAKKLTSKVLSNEVGQLETVLLIDLGEEVRSYNEIKIVPKHNNFCRKVTVEGSQDNSQWHTIRKGIGVYSLSYQERQSYFASVTNEIYAGYGLSRYSSQNLSFRFPEASYRYLRIAVPHDEDKEPVELSDAEVYRSETAETEKASYPGRITGSEVGEDGKSVSVVIDLGSKNLPIEGIEIFSSQTNYFRQIEVQSSNDMKEWKAAGSGTIFSILLDGSLSANNVIHFNETKSRYVKLKVLNGDNKPIKIDSVKAIGLKRFAVFLRDKDHSYSLWYGNPKAEAVSYDIDRILNNRSFADFGGTALGEELKNAAYEPLSDKKPWTEDKPYLLWAVMGIIILGLISLGMQVIKKLDEK